MRDVIVTVDEIVQGRSPDLGLRAVKTGNLVESTAKNTQEEDDREVEAARGLLRDRLRSALDIRDQEDIGVLKRKSHLKMRKHHLKKRSLENQTQPAIHCKQADFLKF